MTDTARTAALALDLRHALAGFGVAMRLWADDMLRRLAAVRADLFEVTHPLTARITASPMSARVGDTVTIAWETTGGVLWTFGGGRLLDDGSRVPASGSQQVTITPDGPTTFSIGVFRYDGDPGLTALVTIERVADVAAPSPRRLIPNPADMGPPATYPGVRAFGPGGPKRDDWNQQAAKNCGMGAALHGLALSHPEILQRAVGALPNGNLWVRFRNPTWPIVITDNVYEVAPEFAASQSPPGDGVAGWGLAIEKTIAWERGGFANLEGYEPYKMFLALGMVTGGIGRADFDEDEMLAWLTEQLAAKRICCVGTGAINFDGLLQASHWHFVLKLYRVDGQWYVTLGNPWGKAYDKTIPLRYMLRFDEIQTGESPV
jgi:hypothetical protein